VSPLPAGAFQFRQPFIDLGFKAIWHLRRCAFVRDIAGRAGHSGAAAIAGVRPFPRPSGMVLTDPSDVRTEDALHRSHQAQWRESPATGPGERKYSLEMKGEILEQYPRAVYP
jgi:hypothetical protein